ncbi:MAG TPA: glycosyltransferase family 4 protein [Firmicutes bacterium]|jgi:glycosyltransferase involved in cell wall biosynthesis|nr:glycosyltransferase family 4 protein [Bacillota bacterium]
MRILILLSSFFYSGQTTHVVSLCEALRQCGQEVRLVVTHPKHSAESMHSYTKYLADADVHVAVIPAKRIGDIVRYCKRHHIDVTHAHSSWDFSTAHAIQARCGIPYVISCHSLGLGHQRLQRYLEQAACLICVGPRIMAEVEKHGRKVILMQNAVDLNRFAPMPKADEFTVVYAGRYEQNKLAGIKALGEAIDTFPQPIRFIVAGDRSCAKYAGESGQYVGWESQMEDYMNQSHVVVGTGRAVREGMAAGNACLVLGWSYDGIVTPDDLATASFPDFSGRLNKKELTATAIQDDLLSLYRNRDWLLELQNFGRSYAEQHFNLRQAALQTIEIYKEALTMADEH